MHISIFEFFIDNVKKEEFLNKRVIEVGSKYVNGSIAPFIKKFLNPKEYIGVDIEAGKFVDIICPAEKLVEKFGKESFDIVISTELLEHVYDWRLVINNILEIIKLKPFNPRIYFQYLLTFCPKIYKSLLFLKRKLF